MARQAQHDAQNTYNQGQNLYNSSTNNSNALYSQLVPQFTQEATNPQGFGKTDLSNMTTAAEQSAGGAFGAAKGAAVTGAAANRNSGSFAPVLDQASRQASKNLSDESLNVQNQNAMLKQSQRQQGLTGLMGLQGEQNNDILGSLGIQNNSTNALTNAGNSGWFQNMVALINAFKPGGGNGSQTSSGGGYGGGDPTSGMSDEELAFLGS